MTIAALRRKSASAISEALSPDARLRLDKFAAPETGEQMPVSNYSALPPCIAWQRKLAGSKKLAATLRAQGFDVQHTKHTVAAWAPVGWTQYIDPEGNVRFLDEFTVLRMVWTNLGNGVPEIEFFTRLETGYNPLNQRYYLYDRQNGEVLKWCNTSRQMKRFIARNYPNHEDPAAYRDTLPEPKSAPWWKIW